MIYSQYTCISNKAVNNYDYFQDKNKSYFIIVIAIVFLTIYNKKIFKRRKGGNQNP